MSCCVPHGATAYGCAYSSVCYTHAHGVQRVHLQTWGPGDASNTGDSNMTIVILLSPCAEGYSSSHTACVTWGKPSVMLQSSEHFSYPNTLRSKVTFCCNIYNLWLLDYNKTVPVLITDLFCQYEGVQQEFLQRDSEANIIECVGHLENFVNRMADDGWRKVIETEHVCDFMGCLVLWYKTTLRISTWMYSASLSRYYRPSLTPPRSGFIN